MGRAEAPRLGETGPGERVRHVLRQDGGEMPERHVPEAAADGAARLGARLEEAVIPVPAHGPSRVARYSRMSGRVSGVIGAP